MAKRAIPSISENGWITNSKKILDYLLGYYILTDVGQSYLFINQLTSLPKTYYENINDPDGMAAAVKSDLDKILTQYFDTVEVQTLAKQITNTNQYAILIYASCIDSDGQKIELARITQIDSSVSRKIVEISNYGDGVSYLNSL